MQSLPRNADNAAASAFRTGELQIVLSRPGGASGAIVAPILGGDGCVGALSAEIQGGGEGSEAVQAIAAIVAAHLASVLSFTPAEAEAQTPAKAAQA
jgi:GAF domain-containing protein